MSLKQSIGKQIKKRRIELKMEQVDVQDYAEIGSTTLSKLELGKANVTIDTLEKVLEVLGLELVVKVKVLFDGHKIVPLSFDKKEFYRKRRELADRMSISGVQDKISSV